MADWVLESSDRMEVVCPPLEEFCETNVLLIYPQLDYKNYMIEIEFEQDSTLNTMVDGMSFGARLQNPKFLAFLIVFRYIMFGISVVVLAAYAAFYCRTPAHQLTFEHRFIMLLAVSLVIFNDPIFAVTIFKPSIAAASFSTIFVAQFLGLLVTFWVAMWRRMHREPVNRLTRQADWLAWLLGFLVFAMLTIAGAAASVYTRLDPGVHVYAKRPILHSVFLYMTVALCVILIIGLFYHSYKIYTAWNQVIARHRFFFQWSLMFIIVLFALLASGMYQSYDMNGVQVLLLFLICNFYVLMLTVLWRFWGLDTTGGGAYPREGSFERAKENLGFNYFDKDVDVELSRTGSSGERKSPNDHDSDLQNFKDADGDVDRPYVAFDDENTAEKKTKKSPLGDNERVTFGGRDLNDTNHLDDEEGDARRAKAPVIPAAFHKDA